MRESKDRRSNRDYINRNILSSQVRCIDHNNNNIGIIPIKQAISMAQDEELDLVQITPSKCGNIPLCKILDCDQYKYNLSKKNKDKNRKNRESAIKIKEVKFRPCTDINDLKTKARHVDKFIQDGCRVKIVIVFKGREISHKDVGYRKLDMFLDLVSLDYKVIYQPTMDGKSLLTILEANKSKNVDAKVIIKLHDYYR